MSTKAFSATVAVLCMLAAAGCEPRGTDTPPTHDARVTPGQVINATPAVFSPGPSTRAAGGVIDPDGRPVRPGTKPEPPSREAARAPDSESDADVRLQVARLTRDALARREEELEGIYQRLQEAIHRIGSQDDGDAQDIAVEQFAKLVRIQRQMGQEILDGYSSFLKAMQVYVKDLERAPEGFRQAAAYYRERAKQESNPLFQKNYVLLAENCEAYIRLVRERRDESVTFLREVAEAVGFVEQTVRYLKDLGDFVQLTPGLATASARRAYREQLKAYAKSFAKSQELFERYSQRLKERAFSAQLRAAHERAVALAREAEARRVQEARARQLQQQREEEESVRRAEGLWGEFVALAWQVEAERQRVEQQAVALRARRQSRSAERLLQQWVERRRVLEPYHRPALNLRSGHQAVVYGPGGLTPGKHYPFARGSGEFAGVLKITRRNADGSWEAEPSSGRFAPGDFLLCRL